jgi:hypothetical protein
MKGFPFKRHLILVFTCLLAIGIIVPITTFASPSTHAGSPQKGGGTGTGMAGTASNQSLSQFEVKELTGGTTVVVADGDQLLEGTADTTVLSGFTVHTGDVAKTTWVVGDGQCSTDSAPLQCVDGRPTDVGPGDTAGFTGGNGSLTIGPDAFRGHDPCSWGPDTCLWDTLTSDVTNDVAPGDTSVTATVSSVNYGIYDCLNHVAQVFSTGPKNAAASGGYIAAGVGLRNQGAGNITLTGIPADVQIVQALLYWTILSPSNPGGAMSVNGNPINGTLISGDQADPCWNAGTTWAFRSDVTNQVSSAGGNGTYTLSGYPTGSTSGLNPWDNTTPVPMAEGASLIVIYSQRWGVDSSDHINQSRYNRVTATFGTPDFWGRYIGTGRTKDMDLSEASFAHANGFAILPIYFNYDANAVKGYDTGQEYAKLAIEDAQQRLGISPGVAIFVDIEAVSHPDYLFIQGWYDTFNSNFTDTINGIKFSYQAGYYKAGYYANTLKSSHFDTPFCTALNKEASIATNSFIWTPQPEPQGKVSSNTKKATAPNYNPAVVSCPPHQIPIPAAWQYSIQPKPPVTPKANVDLDEALNSLPLWYPVV